MSGFLSNVSAMAAMEMYRSVNRSVPSPPAEATPTQRIAVSRPEAVIWSASSFRSVDAARYNAVSDALDKGVARIGVARSTTEKVTDTLGDIRALIVRAQDDTARTADYQAGIDARTELIRKYVAGAEFNGVNLLDGSRNEPVPVLSSLNRGSSGAVSATYYPVEPADLSGAGGLQDLGSLTLGSDNSEVLARVDTMLETASEATASFRTAQEDLLRQSSLLAAPTSSLQPGSAGSDKAGLDAASAKSQALQVQQQISVEAFGIVSEAPRALMALLR